jgi:ATP-dependent Clp protease ATP-binding subunit ClpC
MLERFSDQACRAVVRARDEARALNHSWIGTEHLMLALIGEDSGMAAQVLESLGISLEAARRLVEVIIGRVEQTPSGQIHFTPRAAKVLEMTSGLSLGYDHIGTWHILLGLLQEGDGVGAMADHAGRRPVPGGPAGDPVAQQRPGRRGARRGFRPR